MAGFLESFNATNFFRFCLIAKNKMKCTKVRDFKLRTIEEWQYAKCLWGEKVMCPE